MSTAPSVCSDIVDLDDQKHEEEAILPSDEVIPDFADLAGHFEPLESYDFGWQPDDEAAEGGFLAQEPEAEDEGQGWEIVSPTPSKASRLFASSEQTLEKVTLRPDEVPEELVLGCLDSDCEVQFGPDHEPKRCSSCLLFFCSGHLEGPWHFGSTNLPRSRASSSENATAHTSISSSSSSSALPESLRLPRGPGPIFLCSECHKLIPLTCPRSAASSAGEPSQKDQRVLRLTDASPLACEVQALRRTSLADLRCGVNSQDAIHFSACSLILRMLEQLRVCLRSWTEIEREWVAIRSDELVEEDARWIGQLARQANWDVADEVKKVADLLDKAPVSGRQALEVLAVLGRKASAAARSLTERRLGQMATRAAQALSTSSTSELAFALELLLDAARELHRAGSTGGRRAIVNTLLKAAHGNGDDAAAFRGELFWALEARVEAAAASIISGPSIVAGAIGNHTYSEPDEDAWESVALQELLRGPLSPEDSIRPSGWNDVELGLYQQRDWVRRMERGERQSCRVAAWGENRAFPLAVLKPSLRCLGLDGKVNVADSKNAPTIARCRCVDQPRDMRSSSSSSPGTQTESTAGLLFKRDAEMHREHQVGKSLRLLEQMIWEDPALRELLKERGKGLTLEDVRSTYIIAMTGQGTAILEFVEKAHTLKNVQSAQSIHESLSGRLLRSSERGSLLAFLKKHNSAEELPKALLRLAFTAAISVVLGFVAGLGDRHQENFMLTENGRLIHIDYGYFLGQEPLDAVIIHYAFDGIKPAVVLQYEELQETLGNDRLRSIFWPVVKGAYLRIRQYPGLIAEMFYTALIRHPRIDRRGNPAAMQQIWTEAQVFTARICVTALSQKAAQRFIYALVWYCALHLKGAKYRDELKGLRLKEKAHQAVTSVCEAAVSTGRTATHAVGKAAHRVGSAASETTMKDVAEVVKGATSGFFSTVRGFFESSKFDDS